MRPPLELATNPRFSSRTLSDPHADISSINSFLSIPRAFGGATAHIASRRRSVLGVHRFSEMTGGRTRSLLENLVEATAGTKPAVKTDLEDRILRVCQKLHRPGNPMSGQVFVD